MSGSSSRRAGISAPERARESPGKGIGLLINFNVPLLTRGFLRKVSQLFFLPLCLCGEKVFRNFLARTV